MTRYDMSVLIVNFLSSHIVHSIVRRKIRLRSKTLSRTWRNVFMTRGESIAWWQISEPFVAVETKHNTFLAATQRTSSGWCLVLILRWAKIELHRGNRGSEHCASALTSTPNNDPSGNHFTVVNMSSYMHEIVFGEKKTSGRQNLLGQTKFFVPMEPKQQ